MTEFDYRLLRRLRAWTLVFIIGLLISGATAIPLNTELNWLVNWSGAERMVLQSESTNAPGWAAWLVNVRDGLRETNRKHPFIGYAFDWLAFGHFVIAIAFIGAWRDPVRNRWLYDFGLIACALVIPYALVCGAARGIPPGWRMIDCSFGVFGAVPLWLCRKLAIALETRPAGAIPGK